MQRIKGLILAAGQGTRLRPLTNDLPKPLFPFVAPSLLELAYWKLSKAKIDNISINAHYLSDVLTTQIDRSPIISKNINISKEEMLLGTGGALNPILDWIQDDHLLIYNADIISNIDLDKLINKHLESKALVTMALLPTCLPGKNPVFCKDGDILAIGKEHSFTGDQNVSSHTFTGIQIISPMFLKKIPNATPWHIIDIYKELLDSKKHLTCFIHDGFWHDMGNPQDYFLAVMDYVKNQRLELEENLGVQSSAKLIDKKFNLIKEAKIVGSSTIHSNVCISDKLLLPQDSTIGPNTIISHDVLLGNKVHIENSLLLPGSKIEEGEIIKNQIVYKEHRVSVSI